MAPRLATDGEFEQLYRDYLSAVNAVSGPSSLVLKPFLAPSVIHNEIPLDLGGYTKLITPDSKFRILHIVTSIEQGLVAVRLEIIFPDGQTYLEHVFYEWDVNERVIKRVWSLVKEPEAAGGRIK